MDNPIANAGGVSRSPQCRTALPQNGQERLNLGGMKVEIGVEEYNDLTVGMFETAPEGHSLPHVVGIADCPEHFRRPARRALSL